VKNKARSGRKKCTSAIDDRNIKRIYFIYRRISLNAIRCEMNAMGISVSSRTIRRRLSSLGLKGRIPRKKPYLIIGNAKKNVFSGQKNILIGQKITGSK
jgi:hypothetical protein